MNERDELLRWISVQLLMTLAWGALIAVVVTRALAAFGTDASITGVWAVAVVAVGALRLQRLALPRRPRRRAGGSADNAAAEAITAHLRPGGRASARPPEPQIVWSAPLPETLEHRFARMYRHVDRVTYAVAEIRHYDSGVRPVLADIARDRLRRYHGVDFDSEPARSRELMGDDLWNAMTASPTRLPTTGDLDRWLTGLERLAIDQPLGSEPS